MKVLNGFIGVILVLSFIMGVYCSGTTKTYDFKTHLESIASVTEEMPHIEEISYIWTADIVTNDINGYSWPSSADVKEIHLKRWVTEGWFSGDGIQGDTTRWYVFNRWFNWDYPESSSAYWEGWKPINQFIEGIAEISGRVIYSFRWLGGYIESFFELVIAVTPTSGIVERGS